MDREKDIRESGIVTIPILIAITALIIATALAISSISFNQNAITAFSFDGAKALRYATAGGHDALQKLSRDISLTTSSPPYYDLAIADNANCATSMSGCARIQIHSTYSPKIITVTGYSGSAQRKIQIDAVYDNIFAITTTYWNEIKNLPVVSTAWADPIASNSATIKGWTNPNGNDTTAWFRYWTTWPTRCTDSEGTRVPGSGGADGQTWPVSGTDPVDFSEGLTGLSAGTTYYYCAIAEDADGTDVYGQLFGFTTSS